MTKDYYRKILQDSLKSLKNLHYQEASLIEQYERRLDSALELKKVQAQLKKAKLDAPTKRRLKIEEDRLKESYEKFCRSCRSLGRILTQRDVLLKQCKKAYRFLEGEPETTTPLETKITQVLRG